MEISDDTISPGGDRYRCDSSGRTLPEFSPNVPSSHEYLSAWTLLGFDREDESAALAPWSAFIESINAYERALFARGSSHPPMAYFWPRYARDISSGISGVSSGPQTNCLSRAPSLLVEGNLVPFQQRSRNNSIQR